MAIASQLIGRQTELARLRHGLLAQRHQLIVGEAGVGKTRLALEAIAALTVDGSAWGRVGGSPHSATIPLAAFAAFAPDQLGLDVVRTVLSKVATDPRSQSSAGYLLVDDAHWLDVASATVVHQLCIDGRIRLIVTMRSGEPVPPGVSAFLRDADFDVTTLRPLSNQELATLLRSTLGGPVDGGTEARLLNAAGGNTFFLVELINGAVDAGVLSLVRGLWRLSGDHAFAPLLEDVVRAKLEPLRPEARDVVEMLALAGSLPIRILTESEHGEALEELERLDLVRFADEEVHLQHPLYAEVVSRRLPRLARLRHCKVLASLLEERGTLTRQQRLQTTLWRLDVGASLPHDRLLNAAMDAKEAGDTHLAARFGRAAFEQATDAASALLTSWCLAEQGNHRAALDILRSALAETSDIEEQAAIEMRIAEELWWGERNPDAALASLHAARDRLHTHSAAAVLDAQQAVFMMLRGRCEQALSWRELVGHQSPDVRSVSAVAIALALIYNDAAAEGIDMAQQAFESTLAHPPKVVGEPGTHLISRTLGLLHDDRVAEAAELADFIYQATIFLASRQARAWAATVRGQCFMQAGYLAEGWRDLREATTLFQECSLPGLTQWCASGAAIAAAAQGEGVLASESLRDAIDSDATGFEILNVSFERARAWTADANGDAYDADVLASSISDAAALGNFTEAINGVVDLARLGHTDLAQLLRPELQWRSEWAQRRLRLITGIIADDPEQLARIGDDFGSVGVRVLQAEAYALASMAFRRSGAAKQSASYDGRARELASATQALTPILRSLEDSPLLSAREQQIAQLVRAGLTNREVADTLYLSERTVENHLYRAFRKLGVASRDELTAIAD